MSGDVQPRKRKDKKRKKDELGVEEPRGTAAALGEGDVFIHSQHEHGTGGHWCAKIIFFSLLAVLVTLIGLIILENRGVSELEANSVETRYSGVLEGWLEDAPDDDHHDEHTLELLKQHENEEHEEEEADSGIEVEKLEKEVSDEDIRSEEYSNQEAADDDSSQEIPSELPLEDDDDASNDDDDASNDDDDAEDEEFLDDDIDESLPVVERIVAPKGKPLTEVEDEPTTFKPADTLADEEEYEKQQEELRRDEAQASHVWLKLAVGGALLVATHAVVSRAVAPRDNTPTSEDHDSREDTPSISDRRMTLILEEADRTASPKEVVEVVAPIIEKTKPFGIKSIYREESEEEEEVIIDTQVISRPTPPKDFETEDNELFSDEEDADEVEEEDDDIEPEDDDIEQEKAIPEQALPVFENEPDEDVPDVVEMIDNERLEEDLEEEDDEEEISDVDDAELLTRLEAKYGRLPEPERGNKHSKHHCTRVNACSCNIVVGFNVLLTNKYFLA